MPIALGNKNQVELLVDKILDAKEKDTKTDISDLEKQIDKLVYKLYDLTEEEIAIIERSINGK